MTYHEFMMSVLKSHRADDIRPGQQAFNMLHNVRPDIADALYGTDSDPFYMNNNLPRFWSFVESHW
jgi:hypothetical protein